MTYEHIKDALESYGLTRNEIKVFLFLLTNGRHSAGIIAKETQMDRSACYETLKKLLRKGVIRYSIEVKTRFFETSNPETFIDILKDKEEKIRNILPEMKEFHNREKTDTNIQLYKGYKGLKAVFSDILREKKDYCILDSSGQFVKRMPYFAEQFIRQLEKKKIHVRHVVRKDINIHPSKTTEVRYFSKKFLLSSGNTTIFGDKIAIFLWKEDPEAIIIKDKVTTQLYKDYFEIIWKNAEK